MPRDEERRTGHGWLRGSCDQRRPVGERRRLSQLLVVLRAGAPHDRGRPCSLSGGAGVVPDLLNACRRRRIHLHGSTAREEGAASLCSADSSAGPSTALTTWLHERATPEDDAFLDRMGWRC
eukprot:COSAG02_NODE_8953_length_2384_cov_1.177243_1_plen_121_part_10